MFKWLKLLSRSKSERDASVSVGQFIENLGIIAEQVRAICTMAEVELC